MSHPGMIEMEGQGALNESLGTWDSLFAVWEIDGRRKSPSCYQSDVGYEP